MAPTFQTHFHQPPAAAGKAPGRVNLLGEHTDYNHGYVLPTVIPQTTSVQVGFSDDSHHHFYAVALDEQVDLPLATTHCPGFGAYVLGCLDLLAQRGISIPPLNLWIDSSIPIGVGLSSSAALEIACLRALRTLLTLDLSNLDLALIGQQAEHQYAGVQCGIMDQMAVSLAQPGQLLLLDTHTLEYQYLPLPAEAELLVLDSGVPRTLANSGYNQRRAECEAAVQWLGLASLREVQNLHQLQRLPTPLKQRVRHVFTENQRVLAARRGVSAQEFGQMMNASHASLRDDYAVSVAGLDCLVDLLQQQPGAYGARLTGAGFGGACVALIAAGQAQTIAASVLTAYSQQGFCGSILVSP